MFSNSGPDIQMVSSEEYNAALAGNRIVRDIALSISCTPGKDIWNFNLRYLPMLSYPVCHARAVHWLCWN